MAEKNILGLYQTGDEVMPPLMIFGLPLRRDEVEQNVLFDKQAEAVAAAMSTGLSHNTRHNPEDYADDIKNFSRYLAQVIMPTIPGAVNVELTDGGIGLMREVGFTSESGEVLASGFLYGGKEFQGAIVEKDDLELTFHLCFLADTYPDALSNVMYNTNKSIVMMNIEWQPSYHDLHVCSRYFAPSVRERDEAYDMINAIYHGSINEIRDNAFEVQARSILKLPHARLNSGLLEAFQRILKQKDIIITPLMMIRGAEDIKSL